MSRMLGMVSNQEVQEFRALAEFAYNRPLSAFRVLAIQLQLHRTEGLSCICIGTRAGHEGISLQPLPAFGIF
jgi:hypothetical protein